MSSFGGRLLEERERLDLSQPAMADAGRVTMRSQRNYEKGERFPDAAYLAAIAAVGADVRYIITGERDAPPAEVLSADEREMLALFRSASLTGKAAAIGALQGAATAAPSAKVKKQFNISAVGGHVAGRDLVITNKDKS